MSEMKSTLAGINRRLYVEEEKTSEPENLAIETMQNETQRGKKNVRKWKEHQWAVRQPQVTHYTCSWSS